jgi:hypothetical protein
MGILRWVSAAIPGKASWRWWHLNQALKNGAKEEQLDIEREYGEKRRQEMAENIKGLGNDLDFMEL